MVNGLFIERFAMFWFSFISACLISLTNANFRAVITEIQGDMRWHAASVLHPQLSLPLHPYLIGLRRRAPSANQMSADYSTPRTGLCVFARTSALGPVFYENLNGRIHPVSAFLIYNHYY